MTNREAVAAFATVYPGWYSGRAIHIHLKVHLGSEFANETYAGGHVAHMGQILFPEDLTERISKLQPYAKRLDIRRTTQGEDHVFVSQGGSASLGRIDRLSKGPDINGLSADITVAVDPDLTPRLVGPSGRGRNG